MNYPVMVNFNSAYAFLVSESRDILVTAESENFEGVSFASKFQPSLAPCPWQWSFVPDEKFLSNLLVKNSQIQP